ncbi:MAG: TetR/AcrR family transcriptional regulator [Promethearchaeia archaeon]
MSEKKKRKRARAPEKKLEQFEKILDVGREMFVKYGSHGFSMRALAKELGMSQPNIYNYVESKRELWIAIRTRYFSELNDGFREIINNQEGTYLDLFMSLSKYFLEFCTSDFKRFQMMFLISAPKSQQKGPLERNYKPFLLTNVILNIISHALEKESVEDDETLKKTFYYIFSTLLGAALVEVYLRFHESIKEPIAGEFFPLTAKEFREFILYKIRKILEDMPIAHKKLKPLTL